MAVRKYAKYFIEYAPKLTETFLKKLVAQELRDKMVFINTDGTQKG